MITHDSRAGGSYLALRVECDSDPIAEHWALNWVVICTDSVQITAQNAAPREKWLR